MISLGFEVVCVAEIENLPGKRVGVLRGYNWGERHCIDKMSFGIAGLAQRCLDFKLIYYLAQPLQLVETSHKQQHPAPKEVLYRLAIN